MLRDVTAAMQEALLFLRVSRTHGICHLFRRGGFEHRALRLRLGTGGRCSARVDDVLEGSSAATTRRPPFAQHSLRHGAQNATPATPARQPRNNATPTLPTWPDCPIRATTPRAARAPPKRGP